MVIILKNKAPETIRFDRTKIQREPLQGTHVKSGLRTLCLKISLDLSVWIYPESCLIEEEELGTRTPGVDSILSVISMDSRPVKIKGVRLKQCYYIVLLRDVFVALLQ